MKKTIAVVLLLVLAFTMASCGKEDEIPEVEASVWDIAGTGSAGSYEIGPDVKFDAYNPLTGISDMADDRVGLRPIAVSVNNISVSWPQYGTSEADIIYEIVTEGGITRMMCVYADVRQVEQIGSVRSLRDQFMECTYPYDALIVHIGTSIYADQAIAKHNYRTLDGGNVTSTIFTDSSRTGKYASEHTKFTSGKSIYDGMNAAGLETRSSSDISAFNFLAPDETYVPTDGDANTVNFLYSTKTYDGDFRYDEATGKYLKYQRGEAQMDAGNSKQLSFDNVFLLFADISDRGNTGLVEVDYTVGGTGYYFSQGKYVEVEWSKGDYSTNFSFTVKSTGEELEVNCGNSLVAVVTKQNMDTLEIA